MNPVTFKKIIPMILFMLSIIMAASVKSVFAETRYVSDLLVISVRDGQSPNDTILGYIKTATPVDVIEEKENFSRIKNKNDILAVTR